MLRSAVERQFETIGGVLNPLAKVDPGLAAQIADLPRIVAFRNITNVPLAAAFNSPASAL